MGRGADREGARRALTLTRAEVGALPLGPATRYEVELDDRTWLYGHIVVSAWAANNG
jgi:hypothetical protein